MPWCPDCDRYLAPPTVREDGTCPTCGHAVETAPPAPREADHPAVPWHFKTLVVALIVYLGYRAWQGIVWVTHALH